MAQENNVDSVKTDECAKVGNSIPICNTNYFDIGGKEHRVFFVVMCCVVHSVLPL